MVEQIAIAKRINAVGVPERPAAAGFSIGVQRRPKKGSIAHIAGLGRGIE
jgi:hypothetical protein